MPSLSLVQQCILPENWPFFRSKTNDYTAQCLTHGNAFLRLYVNDYNCNKSCPETLSGTCSPCNLVPKLSPDIFLGKGLNRTLTTLRYSFTYSQLVEKYIRSHLNYWDKYSFYPLLMSISEAFSDLSLYTKLSMTETYLWSWN